MALAGSRRRCAGAALPMAFAVAALLGVMLMLSSERLLGVTRLETDAAQRQRARYAAEAVTALREADLTGIAADGDPTRLDRSPDPNCGVEWFGGCLVRWRIEPARVGGSGRWTVNPRGDGATPVGSGYRANQRAYCYRIAAEAYLLTDPANPLVRAPSVDYASTDPRAPWVSPVERACRVQVERQTTLLREPLVGTARGGTPPRWQVFYAADGSTGDLELFDFQTASPLRIQGLVYTNGALYLGGAGSVVSGYWHTCASGGRRIEIGPDPSGQPVQVVAMDGLYRQRKATSLTYALATGPVGREPRDVPLPGVAPMIGENDLNGDGPVLGQHTINGAAVTGNDDSRSRAAKQAAFGVDVVDGEDATTARIATSFRSLTLEPQRLVAPGVPLYDADGIFDGADPGTWNLTINPSPSCAALYYQANPAFAAAPGVATAPTDWPVYATEMPLFWRGGRADVWPDAGPIPAAALDADGFPVPGGPLIGDGALYHHWYAQARWGDDGLAATADAGGICIRERPRTIGGPLAWPSTALGQAAFAAAAVAYLEANYSVVWNNTDITADFFGFGLAAAQAAPLGELGALCAYEAFFCDRREINWLCSSGSPLLGGMLAWDYHFLSGPVNVPTSPAGGFQTSAFTLDLAAVKAFLTARGATSATFNGKIYVARSFRLGGQDGAHDPLRPYGYHPVLAPRCTARDLDPRLNPKTLVWWGGTTAYPGRETTVLPLSWKAVRIAHAEDVDTGIDSPATGQPLGLAVITPNTCYIRGDVNTLSPRPTPMAVLCDGAVIQSTAWSDAQNARYFTGTPAQPTPAAATRWRLSLVANNVPTQEMRSVRKEDDSGWWRQSSPATPEVRDSFGLVGLIRRLEAWGGASPVAFALTGQIVVPGRQRYSDSPMRSGGYSAYGNGGQWDLFSDEELTANTAVPPVEVVGASVGSSIATVHFVE